MFSRATTAVALCVLLAGCGTAHWLTDQNPSGGEQVAEQAAGQAGKSADLAVHSSDLIFVRTDEGLQAVDAGDGAVAGAIPAISEGSAAPRLTSIVSTTSDGSSTTVTRTTPAGGALAQARVPGDLVARVVTEELVALADRAGAGETPYLPAPKERTRIAVLDDDGAYKEYRLVGNFEPEAFKVDGSELFMIEYIPALAPERYRVRRLRLGSGKVLPIGRLKLRAPGQMQGTGRTQVMSPYGDELYTLYTQQIERGHASSGPATPVDPSERHGHEEEKGTTGGHAFVHLLNLRDSWAHCIDLPPAFGSASAMGSAIAVNPSGSRVFVANWTRGVVAALNPSRVSVVGSGELHLGHAETQTSAAASDEWLFVGGEDMVAVIDPRTLDIVDRWDIGEAVTDVEVADDLLYVTTPSGVTVLETQDGRQVDRISVEGVTGIEGIVSAPR